jgi:serine/threonine protein kinase
LRDLVGERLGDFEVVRELGRGGMGVVYEARQVSLGRRVALKVLSGGPGLTPKAVQRFHREAAAAAKLHHTNVVPVYTVGEQDGTHFYAMELIDGPSLDQVIRQLRQAGGDVSAAGGPARPGGGSSGASDGETADHLAATGPYVERAPGPAAYAGPSSSSLGSGGGYFDAVARMIAGVADALEYAHRQGVVHRDIKPSNLLLSPEGRLSVNDFGLARVLEEPGMTQTGEFVGTPAYTSPEQIASGRIPLDHRTDIYSLGATLYELLTLRPPFTGSQRDEVLAQIVHKEPPPPRKVNRRVPVDLETICLKALEKDPDRRYPSAGELAEDLRRYVNRFAIAARRAGPVRRLVKLVRRHPAVAASLGCVLLAFCVAAAFAYRADRAEQRRLTEHREAEARLGEERERARRTLLDEKVRAAYLIAAGGDLKRTDEAVKEIETLGASTGQVRLLRGMVAYFRQDTEGAIGELEQAVKLLPESIAARALLAMAYADNGQEERQGQLSQEMERLSPSCPEDYLFRGYARESNEPGRGLADVDEGIRQRDSPLGRALRAFVRANRAVDAASPQDAEEALADADAARGMLPTNQLVLYTSVYARLAAAAVYREAGRPEEERGAVLKDAARDVRALEPFVGLTNPAWMMWQYQDDTDDPRAALDVARRAFDRSQSAIVTLCYVISLYRQHKFAEALACFDRRQQRDLIGDVTRGFVLAESPGGPRRALEESDKLARTYARETWELRYRAYLLLFLGRKGQALATLRRFRPPFVLSEDWREFFEAMRRFGCGELTEDEYLARAGGSRFMRGFAHFEVGLFRLADGDRAGARQHFAEAVRTHAVWEFQWAWARMFLHRLESDPNWPPWVPAKK